MKNSVDCTVRCVQHSLDNKRVALAFNKDDSEEVIRVNIPQHQVAILMEMLKNKPLSTAILQYQPEDPDHQDPPHLSG